MLQTGQVLRLQIENLSNQGAGVARQDGLAIFVPGALAGETVVARLSRLHKRYAEAVLVEVEQPAAARRKPPCPAFGQCGGCLLQHMQEAEQLIWKQRWLAEALSRLGGLKLAIPAIIPPEPWHYRNRVQLHVEWQEEQLSLGFYAQNSRTIVEYAGCLLMRPALQEAARLLRQRLPLWRTVLTGLHHLVLRCNSSGSQILLSLIGVEDTPRLRELAAALLAEEPRLVSVWANSGRAVYGIYREDWSHLAGSAYYAENLAGLQLELSPASFAQVNPEQAELLYEQVRYFAALTGRETVLDLYSGVGAIALYLAGQARQVIGVEEYLPAVLDARRNAGLNQLGNCQFRTGKAEVVLPQLLAQGITAQVAILDPPRAGCAASILHAVAEAQIGRIVYVSCDPATLARDLKLLVQLGYAAEAARAFDLFPQTGSLESIVLLSKAGA